MGLRPTLPPACPARGLAATGQLGGPWTPNFPPTVQGLKPTPLVLRNVTPTVGRDYHSHLKSPSAMNRTCRRYLQFQFGINPRAIWRPTWRAFRTGGVAGTRPTAALWRRTWTERGSGTGLSSATPRGARS